MSALDVFGFVTGVASVWLSVRNDVWNWPVGIVNSAAFFWSFAVAGLYADSGLQIVYVGIGVYGWVYWLRGGAAREPAPIGRLGGRGLGLALAFVVVATLAFATVLQSWFHSTVPVWDGLTTALSLAAQTLLGRRVIENWAFWIAADLIYVPLYYAKGLPLTALLYAVFLVMCVAGVVRWNGELRAQQGRA